MSSGNWSSLNTGTASSSDHEIGRWTPCPAGNSAGPKGAAPNLSDKPHVQREFAIPVGRRVGTSFGVTVARRGQPNGAAPYAISRSERWTPCPAETAALGGFTAETRRRRDQMARPWPCDSEGWTPCPAGPTPCPCPTSSTTPPPDPRRDLREQSFTHGGRTLADRRDLLAEGGAQLSAPPSEAKWDGSPVARYTMSKITCLPTRRQANYRNKDGTCQERPLPDGRNAIWSAPEEAS
jgi:hypothetical protein